MRQQLDTWYSLCINRSMDAFTKPERYTRGKHPNSIKNLHPYKPGENGHGRVYPLKLRLAHALDKPLIEPKADACAGDRLVYSTLIGALEREPTPFKEVWERIEGKVTQPVSGDFGITIKEVVMVREEKQNATEQS